MSGAPGVDRAVPPAPVPLRPFHVPDVHRRTLSNGLKVLVAESHDLPVVSFGVLLPAGAAVEEDARAGLAVLTGDLLESGAGGRSGARIAEELEGLGVLQDSAVSWDSTHVGFTALRSTLEPAAEILADLLLRPAFPEDEVARLRTERLAAIAQRRSSPGTLANEVALRFIYARGSPYARSLGGVPESVEGLTRQDVREFHATRYLPAGATVIAAGDLSADEAAGLAERAFGGWVGAPAAGGEGENRANPGGAGIVLVDRPGSVQAEIRVGHVGISRADPDFFAVTIMNQVVGGAFSSRLNLNLRERHGFTYGVSSSFAPRRGPGPFLVSTAVQTEVTGPAVMEILRELRGMREGPVTQEEMDDTRSYLAGVFPLRLETTTGIATRLAQLALYGLPDDYFDHYRERILEVSAEDVLRAARAHLRPDDLSIVVVGDASALRGPLEALGIGEVRLYDPLSPGA